MDTERLIKRLVGKSPKEAGISGEQLTTDLKARFSYATGVILVSAAIGFLIVAAYVFSAG